MKSYKQFGANFFLIFHLCPVKNGQQSCFIFHNGIGWKILSELLFEGAFLKALLKVILRFYELSQLNQKKYKNRP